MILDDKDVRRSAAGMLKARGERAALECAMTAEKFRRKGDAAGTNAWERILHSVREMQAGPSEAWR